MKYFFGVSSHPMLGRPITPGLYSVQEIDAVDLLDEVDDDESGFSAKPETTWFVQVEPGDVKALTAEQLRDFYRLGIINRQTYLWQPEAQQWVPLSTFVGDEVATQPAAPKPVAAKPAASDDDWDVLMGPGDVRHISLDQLDDFYRLGVIDGQTMVWQAGMTAWTKLEDLLGEDDEEDIWYAQMPSGDVKQLTLEQLDDFYRVDVISERTPIWKEGMNQWMPLGMVAGIAEPSPAPMRAPAQATSIAAPRPLITTAAPAPVKAVAPAASAMAIAAKTVSAAPIPVLSAPPPAMVTTIAPQQSASAGGKWLVRFCVAAGLFAALLRNDVLFSAAQASRQQGSYAQLERQTLGGPSFGTVRAVEQLVAETGGDLAPVRLPWLVQESRAHAAKEAAVAHANVSTPEAAPAQPAQAHTPAAAPVAQAKSDAKVPQSTPAPNVVAATQSAFGSKKAAKAKAAPHAGVSRKASAKGKGKAGVFSSKGDAYDPLNGAM